MDGLTSVTVMVSVPLPQPEDNATAAAEGLSVKPPGEPVTTRAIVVVALNVPDVPVMVMLVVAGVAELATVSVSTLVVAVGLVANDAVTPVGRPEATRVTEPANGLTSVTVIVSAPVAPCAIDRVVAEGLIVKLPAGVIVT